MHQNLTTAQLIISAVQFSHQFFRFALVGSVGTAGHYLTLFLLVRFGQLTPVAASVIGSVVGALINYLLNYKYTFRSQAGHRHALSKFMMVALAGTLINMVIMWLGVNLLSMNYVIVQLMATGTVLLVNFTLNRYWTFRESLR